MEGLCFCALEDDPPLPPPAPEETKTVRTKTSAKRRRTQLTHRFSLPQGPVGPEPKKVVFSSDSPLGLDLEDHDTNGTIIVKSVSGQAEPVRLPNACFSSDTSEMTPLAVWD